MRKQKLLTSLAVALGALCGSFPLFAEDTDIYFTDPSTGSSTIQPNLMLILDTSGSMNANVAGTTQNRVDVMREAIKAILDETTNVNVGLMRFSSSPGGPVLYPIKDIDAVVADTGKVTMTVQNATDDAEENRSSGAVATNTTTLHLHRNVADGYETMVGVRFRDVYIPQGATITSAKIVFRAAESDSGTVNLRITADASDDAPTYAALTNNISSRTQTTAAAAWNVSAWAPDLSQPYRADTHHYETPDITSVVQEVVDRAGWCRGNSMAFTFARTGTDTGERVARAYETYGSNSFASPVASLVVTYDPTTVPGSSSCHQVVARVSLDTDDAEEITSSGSTNGNMALTGTLQMAETGSSPRKSQAVGIRFQKLRVPQGATITSARIEFEVDTTNTSSTSLTIKGEAADNTTTFTGTNSNISSRPTTTASVTWSSVPNLAVNQKLVSPDIKTIVQEIVNRPGWANGNAVSFVITGTGTKNVESFDTEPGAAPLLRVTYSSNTAPVETVRDVLKEIVGGMRAEGATPIVDSLYEAAVYYRGQDVTYGKVRGPRNFTFGRWTRVSHPLSYTGGILNQPSGCTDADLDALACTTEEITGSPQYIYPITASCQLNHVILLTDGEATANSSAGLIRTLTGASSCSGSTDEECGLELVDFMRTKDQDPNNAFSGLQTVTTHTIGYNIDSNFLKNLAAKGGGSYKTASDAASLAAAFDDLLNDVLSNPTSFVSPSLSVNAFNKLFNRDEVYFSLFSPRLQTAWPGNIKKFKLCADTTNTACTFGEVLDANNAGAVGTDAKIKATAQSYWSGVADGPTVTLGGAGSQVPAYGSRRVYTYTGTADSQSPPVDLSGSAHVVQTSNAAITQAMLGAVDSTERTNIIDWMRGQDVQDEDNDNSTVDDRWRFADALHSRPLTITYGGTQANPAIKIVVGTNDGGVRMIDAASGVEDWIVYLPEFLDDQKELMENANGAHTYGVDGTPSVLVVDNNNDGIIDPSANDKVQLFTGMRRGGRDIYAFDITPPSILTTSSSVGTIKPKFMWRIKGGTGSFTALGQTWSQPLVATIRVKCPASDATCDDGDSTTADSKAKTVLIFGGGYDPSQDDVIPAGEDAMGNAIYIVDPDTGARIWWAGKTGSGADFTHDNLKYSIASDLALVDTNRDRAIDRVYVGDTRGQIWRFDLGDQIDGSASTPAQRNGGTSGYVFADVGCEGGSRATNCSATSNQNRRKFFYRPDVAQVEDPNLSSNSKYDLVTIASGDREDPLDKLTKALSQEPVHNRLYAFRDYNIKTGAPATTPVPITDYVTGGTLYDATLNKLGTLTGIPLQDEVNILRTKNGWFIDLKESSTPNWVGEKGLAKTVIFGGVLFATTYTPSTGSSAVCAQPAEGTGRLYALNYLSGTAVFDFSGDGTPDRQYQVGGGIPSELVVVIREGGVTTLVGTSGGAAAPDLDLGFPRYNTYWKEE
ncbi:MAG: VWA domain-containing protein [Gammaproteobacteria bacterium]